MNKLVKLFAALGLMVSVALPTTAKAEGLNPWVDCGIGAMIFSNLPVGAVISNVIWDLGTTAVTSAGVSKNTCEGKRAKTAMFIGATYANLEDETVKGNGQHMHAMLNIMSCKASAHDGIIQSVRSDFAKSLQSASYAGKSMPQKAEEYYNIVQAKVTGEFASQCAAI